MPIVAQASRLHQFQVAIQNRYMCKQDTCATEEVQTAITKIITTLGEAEQAFNLARTTNSEFFTEWWQDLPDLTELEKAVLDWVRGQYRYHRAQGDLAEGVVNLIMVSRLLELAGFYDPPFTMGSEIPVEVTVQNPIDATETQTLKGRLDFTVISKQLWLVVLESKGTGLNLFTAIPQTLSYMMANPQPDRVIYGVATHGDSFFFLKLKQNPVSEYDLSDVFSLAPLQNRLYGVLQVLKNLSQEFTAQSIERNN
jgi:uncharacterized protein